jgi:hypothetical protein
MARQSFQRGGATVFGLLQAGLALAGATLIAQVRDAGIGHPILRLQDGSEAELARVALDAPGKWRINGRTVTTGHTLEAWFKHTKGMSFLPPMGFGSDWNLLVLRSAEGDEWMPNGGSFDREADLISYSFPIFPRRARMLTLRVYHLSGILPPGASDPPPVDLTVPNPAAREYPVWTPERFPITRRDGDLSMALTALYTGAEVNQPRVVAKRAELGCTQLFFRVRQRGRPAPEWEPVDVTCIDATGNKMEVEEDRLKFVRSDIVYWMYGQLPSGEPSWRVRAEFSRYRSSGATPDYVWKVQGLKLPVAGAPAPPPVRVSPGFSIEATEAGLDNSGTLEARFRVRLPRSGLGFRLSM